MADYSNSTVRLDVLKERAYNMRWAEQEEGVIPLTAADSDFPPAPEIAQSLIEYIQGGYFCYVPHRGMQQFKESVARALKARKNEDVSAELVLPIDSAARGMEVIARTVLRPGDEAIVFDPVDFFSRPPWRQPARKSFFTP